MQKSKWDIMRSHLSLVQIHHTHDYRTLYDLLKERTPNQSISHGKMPTFEEHMKYVASRPHKEWNYIICRDENDNPVKVGTIYISQKNEIGIWVFKRFNKHGFASIALMKMLEEHPGEHKVLANINPKNGPSISFFRKHGFRPLQTTYVLERD